jgi:RNA polymerase sigma-70 factor (ECF subfamily)
MHEPPGCRIEGWDWPGLAAVALRESRRILGTGQDAEDAAQETMIRAFKSRARCLSPDAPEGWVRAIARREAYRQFTALRSSEGIVGRTAERTVEAASYVIHDALAARDVLSRVPAADRALLLRRYLLDQSSTQIAADLAVPAATVRVRLHRAVKRLRESTSAPDAVQSGSGERRGPGQRVPNGVPYRPPPKAAQTERA